MGLKQPYPEGHCTTRFQVTIPTQPTPAGEAIVISDEELKSLTDAIYQRHGIDFSCYEPKSLKRRVVRALHVFGLSAIHELWIRILKDRSFIYPFMDEISVGLTSMFRDPVLWNRLLLILTQEWSEKKQLSIWHAGCSTGEEVYTMGIVLKESGFTGHVRTLATDISNQAMETARRGEYHKAKVDEYDHNYRQFRGGGTIRTYCVENDNQSRMDPALIRHVTFDYHNLITSPFTGTHDIIFCRNVMIYFDTNAKIKLFEKFYNALNPGALFIIGFYDAVLPMVNTSMFRIFDADAKIFQKV